MKLSRICRNLPRALGLFAVFGFLFQCGVIAQSVIPTPMGQPLDFKYNGRTVTAFEPSAVEPINDCGDLFVVANDKILDLGGVATTIILAGPDGTILKPLSIPGVLNDQKWEAMAKDGDYFYLLSAHDIPGHNQLIRFSIDKTKLEINETVQRFTISPSLRKQRLITDWAKDQVKLEGLAIRNSETGKEMVIGFRKPFTDDKLVQVFKAEIPSCNISPCELNFEPFFCFNAGFPKGYNVPFEISSLEYSDLRRGFVVLTSAEDETATGTERLKGNAIWSIEDREIVLEKGKGKAKAKVRATVKAEKKEEIPKDVCTLISSDYFDKHPPIEFGFGTKAEGLCILSNAPNNRLVIVFDNDRSPCWPNPDMGLAVVKMKTSTS